MHVVLHANNIQSVVLGRESYSVGFVHFKVVVVVGEEEVTVLASKKPKSFVLSPVILVSRMLETC